MALDRLAELKGGERSNPLQDNAHSIPGSGGDIEMGGPLKAVERPSKGEDGASKFMADFFKDVDMIKGDIKEIKSACKKVQEINQNMMQATTSEAEAKLSAELNPVVSKTNRVAKRAKQTLADMAEATNQLKEKAKKAGEVNELRIRENLQNTLSRKFVETVKDYQKRQQEYKDDVKKKVTRQVRIVKEDATEAEIEDVMNSAGGTGELFKTAILKQAADPVREAFEQAQDKYQVCKVIPERNTPLNQVKIMLTLFRDILLRVIVRTGRASLRAIDFGAAPNVRGLRAID